MYLNNGPGARGDLGLTVLGSDRVMIAGGKATYTLDDGAGVR